MLKQKLSDIINNFFYRQKEINNHKNGQESDYYRYLKLDTREYPGEIKKLYTKNTARELNLDNPQRFSEKIQWNKLYGNSPLKTKLTDKLGVRDYVAEKIDKRLLKHIYNVWDRFEDIDFDTLPDSFVLKTNHGFRMQHKVENKQKFLKTEYEVAKQDFHKWLDTNFAFCGGFELQYKDIKPRIFAEELITNGINDDAEDFEFFCFDGEPKMLMYSIHRGNTYKSAFFDENYKKIPLKIFSDEETTDLPECESLLKAEAYSRQLSREFSFVRVDFMRVAGDNIAYFDKTTALNPSERLVFSEMTFTPQSGYYNFMPDEYDYILGNYFVLKK